MSEEEPEDLRREWADRWEEREGAVRGDEYLVPQVEGSCRAERGMG